ncbi:MAG: hypothetical protein OHK93_000655 [Ramalina farinacea]|uniref:Endonuclease/exonuclease/phosphatase domain-containing protein n=1 Tax=Ramalina farinacea TaxID=258253 RepID=A0AA43QFB5_9LECA|nr:hypothetical protein [Ramalina farinacea]
MSSTSSRDVSPPPLKRRKRSPPEHTSCADASESPIAILPAQAQAGRHALRIFSWNINGITPFLPPTTPKITTFLKQPPKTQTPPQPSLRNCCRRWSWPHIVCLQEVKIAHTDTKTQAAVSRHINHPVDPQDEDDAQRHLYEPHFCLPTDKHNATGFGGKVHGVCTLVRKDLEKNVHIKRVAWDLEGRVLIAELAAQGLVIMNVYAVNGTTYDYRDSTTGKVIGTRHDRKRQFHTLLADEVRGYEAKGWGVVVIGDINISRTVIDSFPQLRMGKEHVENRADFERKFMHAREEGALGMCDTFRYDRGEERKYSYRPTNKPWGEGGDRVDMGLVTMGLVGRVEGADILDEEMERGTSDHVPLYLGLSEVEAE